MRRMLKKFIIFLLIAIAVPFPTFAMDLFLICKAEKRVEIGYCGYAVKCTKNGEEIKRFWHEMSYDFSFKVTTSSNNSQLNTAGFAQGRVILHRGEEKIYINDYLNTDKGMAYWSSTKKTIRAQEGTIGFELFEDGNYLFQGGAVGEVIEIGNCKPF